MNIFRHLVILAAIALVSFHLTKIAWAKDAFDPNAAYFGCIKLHLERVLMPGEEKILTPEIKSQLQKDGLVFNGNKAISDTPLAGVWIRIGKQEYNSGSQGCFSMNQLPADVLEGKIYRELSDTTPEATFKVAGHIVPRGQKPNPIIVNVTRSFFPQGEMN